MPKTAICPACEGPRDPRATICRSCASLIAGFNSESGKAAVKARTSIQRQAKALDGLIRHALAEYRAGKTVSIEDLAREAGIK